jgi:hypothetical protein
MIKNKRADIAITILVLGVIALCAVALFSFYVDGSKIKRVANSAYFLQDVYNLAESVEYSKEGLTSKYDEELEEYDIKGFVIKRAYYKKDLGVSGDEEVLKVKYNFNK